MHDLQNDFMGTLVKVSGPVVSFREIFSAKSNQSCPANSSTSTTVSLSKPNPSLRNFAPLYRRFDIRPGINAKMMGRTLADDFGWEASEAKKIWEFGPAGTGPLFSPKPPIRELTTWLKLRNLLSEVHLGFSERSSL